jgi:hypothetical protein
MIFGANFAFLSRIPLLIFCLADISPARTELLSGDGKGNKMYERMHILTEADQSKIHLATMDILEISASIFTNRRRSKFLSTMVSELM